MVAEVIDLRTLVPLDKELILVSVRKTERLVIVQEAVHRGGVASDIASIVQQGAFDYLDAPIEIVAGSVKTQNHLLACPRAGIDIATIPPGCANFIRLVSILYVLDQQGYDGWFGLDLFPYRDDPIDYMKLSVENLRSGQAVVDLMNKKGARELRAKGTDGPAMSRLIRDCIREAR